MFYIWRINPRATKSVSTHEGAFSSSFNLPRSLLPNIQLVKYLGAFCGLEILLPRIEYTDEIVGTHGGALLPERAPRACSGSKTPRVYRPLWKETLQQL